MNPGKDGPERAVWDGVAGGRGGGCALREDVATNWTWQNEGTADTPPPQVQSRMPTGFLWIYVT